MCQRHFNEDVTSGPLPKRTLKYKCFNYSRSIKLNKSRIKNLRP